MQIRFLKSSSAPGRVPFEKDQVADLPEEEAEQLVANGFAIRTNDSVASAGRMASARDVDELRKALGTITERLAELEKTVTESAIPALAALGARLEELAVSTETEAPDFDGMTIEQLKAYAQEHEIDISGKKSQSDLVAAIQAAEAKTEGEEGAA